MSLQRGIALKAWGVSSTVRPADSVEDTSPASHTWSRSRRLGNALTGLWNFTQADYASHYSLEKALYLLHFRQTTWSRWTRRLLTPWGCLVVSLLSELIPLEDPRRGWRGCPNFFLRLFLRTTVFNVGVAVATQEVIPEMTLPLSQLALLSAFQAVGFGGTLALYAQVFNVFPVPFAFFVIVPVYFVFLWASLMVFTRHVLLDKTKPMIRARFERVVRLNGIGPIVLLVYAAFATLFQRVDEREQFALAALLQVLKVLAKRVIWAHAQISPGGDDLAGEHVTASAHFFHALFTVNSLQASKSMLTLAMLVGWNLFYDVLAIRNLLIKSNAVARAWQLVPTNDRMQGRSSRLFRAITILANPRESTAALTGVPIDSSYVRHHEQAQRLLLAIPRVPTTKDDGKHHDISDVERAWLRETTHYFHWRETALLRLYVDIFVPCIYLLFAVVVLKLPNWRYYPPLWDVNMPSLVHRVTAQVGFKLTMLWILVCMIYRQQQQQQQNSRWRRGATADKTPIDDDDDGEPTALQHLDFVLHAHRFTFQSKLLIIGITVLDFPLLHLGNDLTFRFDWIRHKMPPP